MSSEAVMPQTTAVASWIMPDAVAGNAPERLFFKEAGAKASATLSAQFEVRLPYAESALEPYLSARAIRRHCGAHAAFYANEVASRVAGTAYATRSMEDILRGGALCNDLKLVRYACHLHNHQLYWHSMKPGGGGKPRKKLMQAILGSFGSWDEFCAVFRARAANRLWAGWLWLVQDGGRVMLMHATDGSSPLVEGRNPLLALDLWEYAYYTDYSNNREMYVEAFLQHLVDWDAVERRLG